MEQTQAVTIDSRQGPRLAAVLHRPGLAPATAGVIVAHGMLSSKESAKHRQLCERLAAQGLAALRFDFRGRGESEGDPADLTVSNEINDLQAVAGFLAGLGLGRLGIIGSSLGGTVAVLAAPQLPALQALVTVASPAHLPTEPRPEWGIQEHQPDPDLLRLGPGSYLRRHFFVDHRRFDIVAAAAVIGCPWQIVHGSNDEVVPVSDAHDLARANPAASLLLHPEADHRFSAAPWLDWLLDRAVSFLVGQLGPRSTALNGGPAASRRPG